MFDIFRKIKAVEVEMERMKMLVPKKKSQLPKTSPTYSKTSVFSNGLESTLAKKNSSSFKNP
jgi:hypothetical protein